MPDLVRDHIRLREVTGRPEAPRQLTEEPEIEIHLLIARAVEGSGRRFSGSARGLDRVAKQRDVCGLIPAAENLLPRLLRVPGDGGDEVHHLSSAGDVLTSLTLPNRYRSGRGVSAQE